MTFSSVTLSEAKGLKILRFAQNDNVVIFKLNSYTTPERGTGFRLRGENTDADGYYHAGDAVDGVFYRLPKALLTDGRYGGLPADAKLLYALMLDRVGLSMKNGWADGSGRVYIYFTHKDVMRLMGCGSDKGTTLMGKLESAGLISRKRQGLGKPARVYVMKVRDRETEDPPAAGRPPEPASGQPENRSPEAPENRSPEARKNRSPETRKNRSPETRKSRSPEAGKTGPIYNDLTEIYNNHTESLSIDPPVPGGSGKERMEAMERMDAMERIRGIRELIRKNIDYESFVEQNPYLRQSVDELVEVMTEAASTEKAFLRVNGEERPAGLVREALLGLDAGHIEYVADCLFESASDVRNIRAYMLTALYNAPQTIGFYYRNWMKRNNKL